MTTVLQAWESLKHVQHAGAERTRWRPETCEFLCYSSFLIFRDYTYNWFVEATLIGNRVRNMCAIISKLLYDKTVKHRVTSSIFIYCYILPVFLFLSSYLNLAIYLTSYFDILFENLILLPNKGACFNDCYMTY